MVFKKFLKRLRFAFSENGEWSDKARMEGWISPVEFELHVGPLLEKCSKILFPSAEQATEWRDLLKNAECVTENGRRKWKT